METRHILAIVGVVSVFGWQNRVKLKSMASTAIAKASPVLSSQKSGWAAALLALLTAFWPDIAPHIPWPSPVVPTPIVERNDPLTKAQTAQRSAEITMLRELAADTSPNTQQKLDKVVVLRDKIRLQTQSVYTDAIAEAVLSNGLLRLADEIEGPKQ